MGFGLGFDLASGLAPIWPQTLYEGPGKREPGLLNGACAPVERQTEAQRQVDKMNKITKLVSLYPFCQQHYLFLCCQSS